MQTDETPTRYFVCDDCAHFWASPYFPDKCENCNGGFLVEASDLEDAEDRSQDILDSRLTDDHSFPR